MALSIEYRPWGSFKILHQHSDYVVKILYINPGQRISLQKHEKREEKWIVVEGEGFVEVGEANYYISDNVEVGEANYYISDKNDPHISAYIPKGKVHRVTNNSDSRLVIAEVQLGECDENDIIRIEDDYNRTEVS